MNAPIKPGSAAVNYTDCTTGRAVVRSRGRDQMIRHIATAAALSLALIAVSDRVSSMLNAPGEAMAFVLQGAAAAAPALAVVPR